MGSNSFEAGARGRRADHETTSYGKRLSRHSAIIEATAGIVSAEHPGALERPTGTAGDLIPPD
jgi:hypothetical protein